MNPVKFDWIQGIARAALDGLLDAETLRDLPAADALDRLQELPGVGPFSAGLILVRGAAAPDVFVTTEPRLLERMRAAYRLPSDASPDTYATIAGAWRPLRSWVAFLLRSAATAPPP